MAAAATTTTDADDDATTNLPLYPLHRHNRRAHDATSLPDETGSGRRLQHLRPGFDSTPKQHLVEVGPRTDEARCIGRVRYGTPHAHGRARGAAKHGTPGPQRRCLPHPAQQSEAAKDLDRPAR